MRKGLGRAGGREAGPGMRKGWTRHRHVHPFRPGQDSSDGGEPGSGRPADSVMNHTATPPISDAAIM
nr:hypothetical protein StreXyl84_45040 [Streptomyces sp. Xyl84]